MIRGNNLAPAPGVVNIAGRLWVYAIWAVTGWFVLNLLALISSVIVSSFSTRWLRSWFPDGWTLRSETGCLTAHSEHTIAITDKGVEVLTLRDGDSFL